MESRGREGNGELNSATRQKKERQCQKRTRRERVSGEKRKGGKKEGRKGVRSQVHQGSCTASWGRVLKKLQTYQPGSGKHNAKKRNDYIATRSWGGRAYSNLIGKERESLR